MPTTTDLPAKRIKKIQLPLASGETAADKTYEIIPDKMQSSGFQATLPTLTADTTLVTADGALKSPYALDIKVNNDAAAYISYDGSATKTLIFQPGNADGSIWIGDGTPVVKTLQLGGVFTDSYPSTFTWTNGTTAGPTGSLSGAMGNPFTAVSFGAIPAASASQSGVVTTDNQTFAGVKTFNSNITLNNSSIVPNTTGTCTIGSSSKRFNTGYINRLYSSSVNIGNNSTTPLYISYNPVNTPAITLSESAVNDYEVEIYTNEDLADNISLYLPATGGTIGLEIPIDDLTSLN